MKSKYTAGSKIHQALCKIETESLDAGTWRKVIHFNDAPVVFDRTIIQPLVNDGFISRFDYNYKITPAGIEKLDNMGRFLKPKLATKRMPPPFTVYVPVNQNISVRPGADDHLQFPSRRGNTLFYKDGREVRHEQN